MFKGFAFVFIKEVLAGFEDFVAFGDSLNDLAMLQAAGRSVAVANGRPDILAVCDDICPSNQEDGVARYLAEHFLGEEAQA